jgi:hypothetical protein
MLDDEKEKKLSESEHNLSDDGKSGFVGKWV